jgi:hypothetical protein
VLTTRFAGAAPARKPSHGHRRRFLESTATSPAELAAHNGVRKALRLDRNGEIAPLVGVCK